jgi:hypothetical protein
MFLLALVMPAYLSAQSLGQGAMREVTVRTTDEAHLVGQGAAVTYGLAAYKFALLSPGISAVRIDKSTVPTIAVDLVLTPPRFLATPLTPYGGGEWNVTALPGTTVPGYVVFAGTTFNQLSKLRKVRSIFGQRAEVVPAFFIEGRAGQFVRNGRYHELDIGFAW